MFPASFKTAIDLSGHKSGSGRLLPIRLQPSIHKRDLGVDGGQAQAFLLGDQLHELVGALDIGRSVVQGARGRGRTR